MPLPQSTLASSQIPAGGHPLRVCQVINCINEHVGGPSLSVPSLAATLSLYGIESHLCTMDNYWSGQQVRVEGVHFHSQRSQLPARYLRGLQPSFSRALKDLAASGLDIIHNHGLWMFTNVYARQVANQHQLPLVISPRGMLEAWSMRYSWYKKWLAWHLYEQKNLASATVFHATSDIEAESIRALGFKQPIALIPNGVSVVDPEQVAPRDVLEQKFPELADKRWLLCLCRLHPKKGLDQLLRVWKTLASNYPDWHLIIAGPDVIGYLETLHSLTAELELQHRVTYTGMVSGDLKTAALGHAELFVLPTHSENFGIAIAEALMYGIPVITTTGTPWQDLQRHQCGWWIEKREPTLTAALIEGLELSLQDRQAMGQRGVALVKDKYSWQAVGEQMAAVYRWIHQGGEPPSYVHFSKDIELKP